MKYEDFIDLEYLPSSEDLIRLFKNIPTRGF